MKITIKDITFKVEMIYCAESDSYYFEMNDESTVVSFERVLSNEEIFNIFPGGIMRLSGNHRNWQDALKESVNSLKSRIKDL